MSSPKSDNTYTYKPLAPGSIRLLHILPSSTASDIHCTMHHFTPTPNTRNRFAALSYCWGDPSPVATITVDEQPLPIAHNLHLFLQNRFLHGPKRMLSHESPVLSQRDLWIDAVCINQADDEEKSKLVSRMWEVYSWADLVIAWLGPEEEYTDRAFIALTTRYLEKTSGRALPASLQKLVDDGTPAVVELSANRYFSRVWMVQEILCADTCLFLHSGRHATPLRALYHFSALSKGKIATQGAITARTTDGLNICAESLLYTLQRTRDALRRDVHDNEGAYWAMHAYHTTIMDHKNKACADVRDKIFAFRGLPTARVLQGGVFPPLFDVDYGMSVDEVAVVALAYFGKLDALAARFGQPDIQAEYVVIGMLKVDVASPGFRTWLRGKMLRDEERGTLEMVAECGRRVDCRVPLLEKLLRGELAPIAKMLTGRFGDGHEGDEEMEREQVESGRRGRDPKKWTMFPLFGKYEDED